MTDNFEWDPQKAEMNKRKHGVSFAEATTIFDDLRAITIEEQDIDDEDRSITVGTDFVGRLLVVVHTHRGAKIRIISARKANDYERVEYEKP
jgi:uncharacterized DUF497 family protein